MTGAIEETVGTVWSTNTLKVAGAETFPAVSSAVTCNWVAPEGRSSAIENDVPLTVASPRSVLVVASKTSTARPEAPSVPVSVTAPVSVRPVETPVFGEIARSVGAAGKAVFMTQDVERLLVPALPARSLTSAALTVSV